MYENLTMAELIELSIQNLKEISIGLEELKNNIKTRAYEKETTE